MGWFLNPISKWFRNDDREEKDSSISSSALHLKELDHFDSFPVNRSSTRKTNRKRRIRQHHIDREYDLVVVPPDGGCLSGSESDDSDWSIGWFEPHASEFWTTNNTSNSNSNSSKAVTDENSFAVLVPCYRRGQAGWNQRPQEHILGVIGFSEERNSSVHRAIEEECCRELQAIHIHGGGQATSGRSSPDGLMIAFRAKFRIFLQNHLITDVENKVKSVLKLVEEDADSFAKKAEMYYRRRPELIRSIQDIYSSHRALAERFERVSGELQKANDTIATVFPDQVHYESQDEDETGSLKATLVDFSNLQNVILPQSQEKEATSSSDRKRHKLKKISPQMCKEKAREEIYRIQKDIVVLQMEKEFMKSSYLNGLAKYLDIEKKITELQEEVNGLQDESGAEIVIEDDETRALMAVTALKSCEDLLVGLHEQRIRFTEDGRIQTQRMKGSEEKLRTLKIDCGLGSPENASVPSSVEEYLEEEGSDLELQSVCDKFIENFKMGIDVNMLEFSEKIDELVVLVIDLENIASTHEAHVHGLRLEIDEFEKNLQVLEADGITSFGENNEITEKLMCVEGELQRIKQIERGVQDERKKFILQFSEARDTFNGLSDRLQSPRKQDEVVSSGSSLEQDLDRSTGSDQEKKAGKRWSSSQDSNSSGYGQTVISEADNITVKEEESKECMEEEETKDDECKSVRSSCAENDDLVLPNWEQLFKDGMEDREKILLTEYTTILRNYKEAKRRLADEDKKTKDFHSETVTQIRELKNAIEMRDEQIKSLQQELKILQSSWTKSSDDEAEVKASDKLEVTAETHLSVSHRQKDKSVESSEADRLKSEEAVEAADDSEIKEIDEPQALSLVEEKFRSDIDKLLEENLQFWLRCTTCFDQIQKFQSKVEVLQADIEGLKSTNKSETGTSTPTDDGVSEKPEPASICRQLKDLEAEISTWVEENAGVKEELQTRFSSLCKVKEEIVKASTETTEEQQLSGYQAARFNGEVMNMTQENNTVADQLGVGLDHMKSLQEEVVKAIAVLEESTDVSKGKSNGHHHRSKNRSKSKSSSKSFPFNVKPLKPMKPLKFPCMKPQKKHIDVGTAAVP